MSADGGWSQMDLHGEVKLKEADRSGQADHAIFVRAAQTATLAGHAIARDATTQTQARRIIFASRQWRHLRRRRRPLHRLREDSAWSNWGRARQHFLRYNAGQLQNRPCPFTEATPGSGKVTLFSSRDRSNC